MDAQPVASSSTAPPPVVHHATLVFDSGISRERFTQLVEQNGVVHKIVQRLMQKSGNNEQSLRLGLVITAQEAPYSDSRKLYPVTPAYQQDFRRPSAFLTSLPSLARQFTPQAALAPAKPGSIIADAWDIEDGAGLSITSSEPGPSDFFLSSLVAGLELLDHYSAPSAVAPPTALMQMTPDSGLPILSMLYKQPPGEGSSDPRKQYLIVLTDKASLANMDAQSQSSTPWLRDDRNAKYDTVTWDTIGACCKSKGVACSSVILAAPDGAPRPAAPLGREGSTAEKLRKMCLESSGEDNPDPTWFPLPPDSDAFFTGMTVKSTALPAAVPAPTAVADGTKSSTDGINAATSQPASAANGPSEAQIKYQMAQKQAMSLKMAQAAQGGAQGNNSFHVLAQLISAGRLDPNAMAQLASSVRSDDPSTREKAMSQLAALVNQAQNRQNAAAAANGGMNNTANAGNNASTSNAAIAGGAQGANPTGQAGFPGNTNNNGTAGAANPQQAQFLAAMAARQQAMQAQASAAQQQRNNNPGQGGMAQAQLNNLLANQAQNNLLANQAQNSGQQNTQQSPQQQLQNQQQALLLQRQQQLAAQSQGQQQNQQQQQGGNTNMPQQGPQRTQIWSGNISLMIRGTPQLIPVNCSLLAQNVNIADLQLASWPRNLEVSQTLQPMPISELQAFIKQNQPPCVLFSTSPQADPEAIQKMGLLASSLSGRQAAAHIKFGSPGCGILLVSANRGVQPPDGNRILGVVCHKHPLPTPTNPAGVNPNVSAVQQGQQQNQQQPQPQPGQAAVSINGPPSTNATHQFQSSMTGANLPQFLQHAQLLQQQQNQASASPQHARTPSQQQQGMGQTPQTGHQRMPSNQLPSTLQQFANQPNIQTIQQLQMRQLQAQAQQLQPNLNQGGQQGGQPQQPQQQQQQMNQQQQQQQQQLQQAQQQNGAGVRPQQGNNITFTAQQKAGIIKLLRDVNINVSDSFDPNLIPRENLAMIINQAKERARQQQQQGLAKPPVPGGAGQVGGGGAGAGGGATGMGGLAGTQPSASGLPMPSVNTGAGAGAGGYNFSAAAMGNFGGAGGLTMAQLQGMQAAAAGGLGQVQQQQQQPNPLAGLQNLGGFNLQQFQAAQAAQSGGGGNSAAQAAQNQGGGGALGLFAQQGLNPQMLSQFQQHH